MYFFPLFPTKKNIRYHICPIFTPCLDDYDPLHRIFNLNTMFILIIIIHFISYLFIVAQSRTLLFFCMLIIQIMDYWHYLCNDEERYNLFKHYSLKQHIRLQYNTIHYETTSNNRSKKMSCALANDGERCPSS